MHDIHGVPYLVVRYNLCRLFVAATDEQRMEGATWYDAARGEIGRIIDNTGIHYHPDRETLIERGCESLAILSPRCPWEINIEAFRCLANGREPENSRGILPRNWHKAWRHYWTVNERINTRKVRTFADGLRSGGLTSDVCLDTHMLRAGLGREPTNLELGRHFKNTRGCYDSLAEIVREEAGIVGLWPAQYQAIIWLVQRG